MMRKLSYAAILLVFIGQPALASQTACMFSADEESRYDELEFIGYDDMEPTIVFSSTASGSGERITLNPANYSLKHFSQRARKISLEFRNPKNLALPPSFNFNGVDGRAILTIGSSVIEGDLKCDY